MKQIGEIDRSVFITDQYEWFKWLTGNRGLNPRNLQGIKKSIKENGMLISPIIVNNNFEIIDGQHRFIACQELGEKVRYIVAPNYGLKEVQTLNSRGRNWSRKDYLDSFVERKYPSYMILNELYEEYPKLSIQSLIDICTNKTGSHSSVMSDGYANSSQLFIEGGFEILNLEQAVLFLKNIYAIRDVTSIWHNGIFIKAMLVIQRSDKFDWPTFIKRCKMVPMSYTDKLSGKVKDMKMAIEDIYNWNNRSVIVNFRNL